MRRVCFSRHRLQRIPLVSNPGMHNGTCATHEPWCMSGSLTRGGGENIPGIPGACATRNIAYLVKGPWRRTAIQDHGNGKQQKSHVVFTHRAIVARLTYNQRTAILQSWRIWWMYHDKTMTYLHPCETVQTHYTFYCLWKLDCCYDCLLSAAAVQICALFPVAVNYFYVYNISKETKFPWLNYVCVNIFWYAKSVYFVLDQHLQLQFRLFSKWL